MEKVRYMISDAAQIAGVESHVLRYWEDELGLSVPRNELGHRYYTRENIQQFQKIKELKEQGYQLKAIRMILHGQEPEQIFQAGASMGTAYENNCAAPGTPAMPPLHLTETRTPAAPTTHTAGNGISAAQPTRPAEMMGNASAPADGIQLANNGFAPADRGQAAENALASAGMQQPLSAEERMDQFRELMSDIVGHAIAQNNEELSQTIGQEVQERVLKEMDYLMREQENAAEERFKKLDAAIRGSVHKKRSLFAKEKTPKEPKEKKKPAKLQTT